jgi:large subunit ribosomal protein L24
MKFKVGDNVIITTGKDRGKKGQIIKTFPKKNTVVVSGMNMYTRHVKPYAGQPGDLVKRERPLALSKIAIVNDKGQADRIGYTVTKAGAKERIFKKTGKAIPAQAVKKTETKKKAK